MFAANSSQLLFPARRHAVNVVSVASSCFGVCHATASQPSAAVRLRRVSSLPHGFLESKRDLLIEKGFLPEKEGQSPDVKLRSNEEKKAVPLQVEEALYLAKEYGVWTSREVQMQIVRSPAFSEKERPFIIEDFFQVPYFEEDETADGKETAQAAEELRRLRTLALSEGMTEAQLRVIIDDADHPGTALTDAIVMMLKGKTMADLRKKAIEVGITAQELNNLSDAQNVVDEIIENTLAGITKESPVNQVIHGAIQKHFAKRQTKKFLHNGQEWQVRAEGRGTRKRASAHAVITRGSGVIKVNGEQDLYSRWPLFYNRFDIVQPFKLTGTACTYDLFIAVQGGGPSGQSGAARLVVARALLEANPGCFEDLQRGYCLLEDTRQKMSKMPGKEGARASFAWSKR